MSHPKPFLAPSRCPAFDEVRVSASADRRIAGLPFAASSLYPHAILDLWNTPIHFDQKDWEVLSFADGLELM